MQVIAQAPAAAAVTVSTAAGLGVFNVIAGEPGAGSQLNLSLPGSNRLNGQPFVVRAGGIISMSAGTYTATIQPLVFASTTAGFTAALGNVIALTAVTAAMAVTSTAAVVSPFEIELHCIGDSTSGLLQGWFQAQNPTSASGATVTSATTSPTILGRILSSVNYASEPPLQFAIGVSLATGTAAAGVVSQLTSFQIEA